MGAGHLCNLMDDLQGINRSSTHIMRLLQTHQRRWRIMKPLWPNSGFDRFRREAPAITRHANQLDTGERRGRSPFIANEMGRTIHDHLITGPGVQPESQLIAHHP